MKKIVTYCFVITFSCMACQNDDDKKIDAELAEFIEVFLEEAEIREVAIDLGMLDISAHIMNIQERNIVGQCYTYSNDSKEIIIDENYWRELDYLDKEYIMLHELGHCILDRDHINNKDASGNCISIMQSGSGTCDKQYTYTNRKQLIDELFNI